MHRQRDLRGRRLRRLERRHLLLFDEAEDVLEHDDRVVDDDADHQHQREHRHAVEREVERRHHAERRDDRRRNRDAGDDRRAPVAHEREHDQAGENAAEHEVQVDLVQRRVDVARLVADDVELHVARAAAPRTRSRLAFTPSITATVFAPDWRRTSSVTVGHAVRAARATAAPWCRPRRSRCRGCGSGAPLRVAITRSLNARGSATRPIVRSVCSRALAGDVAAGQVGVLARRARRAPR